MLRIFIWSLNMLIALQLAGCAGIPLSPLEPIRTHILELRMDNDSITSHISGGHYFKLQHPTSLSGRGDEIYVVDTGLSRIVHYGADLQSLTPLPLATEITIEAHVAVHIAPDGSVYITQPSRGKVLHFNSQGIPLLPLVSPGNLIRPSFIAMDEQNGLVLVADSLLNHVVVFDNWGVVLSIIKPQRVKSIGAMATDSDRLYILDPANKQVIVSSIEDGSFLYAFGTNTPKPSSMAVSRDNLVFVGDSSSNLVGVYKNRRLVESIAISDSDTSDLRGVTSLAAQEDQLYIADSLSAQLQIMLINPEALDVVDRTPRGITMTQGGEFRSRTRNSTLRKNGLLFPLENP